MTERKRLHIAWQRKKTYLDITTATVTAETDFDFAKTSTEPTTVEDIKNKIFKY